MIHEARMMIKIIMSGRMGERGGGEGMGRGEGERGEGRGRGVGERGEGEY